MFLKVVKESDNRKNLNFNSIFLFHNLFKIQELHTFIKIRCWIFIFLIIFKCTNYTARESECILGFIYWKTALTWGIFCRLQPRLKLHNFLFLDFFVFANLCADSRMQNQLILASTNHRPTGVIYSPKSTPGVEKSL